MAARGIELGLGLLDKICERDPVCRRHAYDVAKAHYRRVRGLHERGVNMPTVSSHSSRSLKRKPHCRGAFCRDRVHTALQRTRRGGTRPEIRGNRAEEGSQMFPTAPGLAGLIDVADVPDRTDHNEQHGHCDADTPEYVAAEHPAEDHRNHK
ncbi:hypothetical protein Cst04h_08040 [Corynebacterium striatum]|uniref:Transposase n=1 Tax=Corynebacterium striatum TaxID=43770 RepID=A0ABC9ZKD6_CORST|nr:hypothetical protein Cst04h_08040 [Corynebacterium striatum]CQD04345.1 hypothetical protein U2A4042130014 [Corynebacterium striatum]